MLHRLACGAIAALLLAAAPLAQQAFDSGDLSAVVHDVSRTVASQYFDAAIGARAADRIERQLRRGAYQSMSTDEALAAALSRDLFDATHDKHLAVAALRADAGGPGAAGERESREARGLREHFGVREATILDGNVGYLDLVAFYRATEVRDAMASAMTTLAPAKVLVVDLRENGGGAPDAVALLAGYFFEQPGKPLFDIVPRTGDPRHYLTPDPPVSPRDERRPVFVLTSARTFSAGEGFAFLLQELHRARIVGERTAGAANPGRAYPVGRRFEVTVPNGRVRTVVSKRNWERTGVEPDVRVPAAAALDRALQLARR